MQETLNSEIEVSCITTIYNRDDCINYSQAPPEPGAPPTQEKESLCDLEKKENTDLLQESNCSDVEREQNPGHQSPCSHPEQHNLSFKPIVPSEEKYSAAAPIKSEQKIYEPPSNPSERSATTVRTKPQTDSKGVAPDSKEPWLDAERNFKPEMIQVLCETFTNLYQYADGSCNKIKAKRTLSNMRNQHQWEDLEELWGRAQEQISRREENERLRASIEVSSEGKVDVAPPMSHRFEVEPDPKIARSNRSSGQPERSDSDESGNLNSRRLPEIPQPLFDPEEFKQQLLTSVAAMSGKKFCRRR